MKDGLAPSANYNKETVCSVLLKFYADELVKEVIEEILLNGANLNDFEIIDCPNCGSWDFSDNCNYENLKELHKKLKLLYSQNQIDKCKTFIE